MKTPKASKKEIVPTAGSGDDQTAALIPAETVEQAKLARFKQLLDECYAAGEAALAAGSLAAQEAVLGEKLFADAVSLSNIRHAARGVALTLAAYKVITPEQDIRYHKSEHEGGFSARSIDHAGTVPFLQAHSLEYNVDTHWLSQTFSFAGPYLPDLILRTNPKTAGPLMLKVVNAVQSATDSTATSKAILAVFFRALIDSRNRGKVQLEKPQNLSIEQTISLLEAHFLHGYKTNSPRLPQLAIYAIYQCTMPAMVRYKDLNLMPLERMKAANRKSGSVGDVDVNKSDEPYEAVEVKFQLGVNRDHVAEAIQKIKTVSVQRYLILSTGGIEEGESDEILRLTDDFRRSNGCEIIVNGVLETIKYYLRLIESPSVFINRYTALVESDADLGYEHRLAWNEVCANRKQ